MSQQFYVIRKQDGDLEHAFKYIKREKVNGKWRYYYDSDLDNKYKTNDWSYKQGYDSKGEIDSTKSISKEWKDTNKLFSNTKTGKTSNGSKEIIYERGKLERASATMQKKLFQGSKATSKFLKKTTKSLKKSAKKGAKKVDNLLHKKRNDKAKKLVSDTQTKLKNMTNKK